MPKVWSSDAGDSLRNLYSMTTEAASAVDLTPGLEALRQTVQRNSSLPSPEKCREIRERAGATQKDVAVACGVTQVTVSHWEQGVFNPTGQRLELYLRALRVMATA